MIQELLAVCRSVTIQLSDARDAIVQETLEKTVPQDSAMTCIQQFLEEKQDVLHHLELFLNAQHLGLDVQIASLSSR